MLRTASEWLLRYDHIERLKFNHDCFNVPLINDDAMVFGFVLNGMIGIGDSISHAYQLSSGELFYVPKHSKYILQRIQEDAELVLIYFKVVLEHPMRLRAPDSLFNLDNDPHSAEQSSYLTLREPKARFWIEELLQLGQDKTQLGSCFQLQSNLYAIASAFIKAYEKGLEGIRDSGQSLIAAMIEAKRYMLEHFNETIDMERLALQFDMSTSRFYHLFKQYTGFSPHKFITTARLNESLHLLSKTSLTVTEAAHAVGYFDELYFSRFFKKRVGLSPSEYMARTQRQIVNLCPTIQGELQVLGFSATLVRLTDGLEQDLKHLKEKLLTLNPEIIIMPSNLEEYQKALAHIAPVIWVDCVSKSWQSRLKALSEKLDLNGVADRFLRVYRLKVDHAKKRLQQLTKGEPYLLIHADTDSIRIFGLKQHGITGVFYNELLLIPPQSIKDMSYVDVESLSAAAKFGCSNAVFLVSSSEPAELRMQLESQWRELGHEGMLFSSVVVPYDGMLDDHAQVYDQLLDQMLHQCFIRQT